MATFKFQTPPGVVLEAQTRTGTQTVEGQERDMSERARFIQERRTWKAVIDAERQRIEAFLRTCTFD